MFFKIGVLKSFRIFPENTCPVLDSLFDKVAGLEACDVIPTQVFSYGYCEFFKRTLFFTEDLRWLLLKKL